jgi:hypothetical protein
LLKRANNPLSLVACLLAAAALAPAVALADTSGTTGPTGSTGATGTTGVPGNTGGVSPNDPQFQPAAKGKIVNGMAIAPASAPPEVFAAIAAANKIARKPYRYGGGHGSFRSHGYDCSGAVSYALHGAGLLSKPLDSSDFMKWGDPGVGKWITIYTNPGHAFAVIAGLRLDTSPAGDPSGLRGPRWRPVLRSTRGFKARHPLGF